MAQAPLPLTALSEAQRAQALARLAMIRPALEQEVTHDQRLAEPFFAARAQPTEALPSVGAKALGVYVADKGFAGDDPHTQWREFYGAEVITAPHQGESRRSGPKRGVAGWLGCERRVETIYDKLLNIFRLRRERPHEPLRLSGSPGG